MFENLKSPLLITFPPSLAASRPQKEPGEYDRQRESVNQKVDPVTGG